MFSIRSKLISLLQPWLQSEPDLELKLGFLRSHGTVQNLQFNVSALNQLIGDSTFFSFEEVKVQDFNIRFSPWSGPALTVELSGLYANLIAREPVDDGRRSGIDRFEKEKNDILSALDPEGALLHNAIERIFKVTSMKWHMTSLLNVFMRHCRLLIHDIHLELQTCALDETFTSFFKMKELRLEALHLAHSCLLKGVIGAIIIPQRVCQVALNADTLEIGLKRDKHIRCLLFLDVILTRIKLKDLRLLDLDVCASQLNISFTPTDLSYLQALNVLAFKEIKHVRNGRELWSIASRRISCLTSNPKLSLHKLVGVVSLWLRYVHSYETLLLMLGYPAEAIIEQSSNRILVDEKFSVHVKNQWKVVSTIEKDLPVEVLARARRIACQRAAVYNPNIGVNIRPHLEVNGNQFLKILSILMRTICDIFQSVAHFLNTHVVFSRHPEVNGTIGVLSENTYQHYCVNFRNILITVYPDIPSVNGVVPESHVYLSHLNLLLFCVTLDAFLLLYTSGNISQSLSLSCGDVKIQASSLMASPMKRSLREETKRSFRKKRNERLTKSKVIVWGEPALKSLHQENIATHSPNSTGSGCSFHLDSCLEELWLNWNKSYKKFEGSNNQCMGNPFLLCEITSSLVDRCPDRPDIGIWKCFMSVGKLNVDLGHSFIISVALLLRQIQHALYSFPGHRRNVVYSQSPSFNEPQEIRWEVLKQLYTSETKLAMLRMAPEKNIQIGVAIAGPKIRVSLQDDLYGRKQDDSNVVTQGQGDLCIVFNLEAIELSVWPTSKASLVASTNGLKTDDVGSECSRLNELQSLDILGEGLHKKFSYQGCIILDSCAGVSDLTVYLEDLVDNHQYQLIGSKSISIHSLLCRDCTLSFTTTSIALSASLCGTATESIALLFMDEFEIVLQVVERVLSALSFVFTNLKNINSGYPPEVIRESEASVEMDLDAFTEASEAGMLLVLKQTQSVVNASFMFGSVDVIIHNSRKNHSVERYKTEYKDSHYNFLGGRDVLEQGIAVSVQNSHAQLLWEEGHFKTHICILGFQIIIFHSRQIGEPRDVYELRNFLYDSPSCLCELTLSNFSLTLCTSTFIAMDNYASGSTMLNSVAGSLAILNGRSDLQSCDFNHGTRSNLLLKPPAQLLINISLDEIVMAEYSLKDVLIRADEQKKLLSTFNIGRERHTISWTMQGGLVILETTAFALFVHCFGAYYLWIQNAASILSSGQNVSSRGLPEAVNPYKQMNRLSNHPSQEGLLGSTSSMSHLGTCDTHSQSKLQLLESLTLSLHDFSLVLVTADGSGGVWELILAADVQLNIELMSTGRKVFFDLSRLTILSRHFHGICPENVKDIQNLHLSPVADNKFSSETICGDISPEFQPMESLPAEDHDSHASVSQDPQEGNIVNDDLAGCSQSKHENYILKHGVASVLVENPVLMHHVGSLWLNSNWVGHCSVSGLDLMISLSEIQMIVSLIEPLSAVSSERVSVKSTQSFSSRDQGQDNIVEDVIPDGAVVAMQDIHQHTYFAVEGIENKFRVCGIVHYSLVEEKALFQVKYCRKKRWQSAGLWFTLISLHAKSSSGEPLLLNYRPGSGFVDISGNNDDCSLWRTLPYGLEPYEADIDLDSNSQAPRNIFYLVNKKSNCSVAFIDGVPEFVKKPGNPFKVKLFPGVPHIHEVLRLNNQLEGSHEQDVQDHTHEGEGRAYGPCINITFDKVQMTIVHELPDSNDKIPLLQACIKNIEFIVQILCSKVRIMSTFLAAVYYFDAQGNLWREIVCPVEMCMFYRSRFQSSKTGSKGVPIHYYFRIKQVDVSLTELSLDVLLFVAGELRIAGPFAVRSSAIFANCCKIHNKSSLSLLCHLYDGQNATIAGNHSTSVFIRPVALVNRPVSPPNPRFLSVQLMASGDFITSPISVSLLSARVLAWRTRITSLHGSRSSPGPFVVVAVSKTTENGLSVVVSPLLRIHNETGLSMEIRFMRPQHKEAESASVLLRDGDTVDDSMAALDAINLSGGSKKVLTSLTLGNFLFSCKPDITKHSENLVKPVSVDWSQDLKGGKAVRLSGVFDKLNYKFRQALGVDSVKMSFSTVKCSLDVEGAHISDLHFIIQTIGKDVPVIHPDNSKDTSETRNAPVALQEQKEIFLLPTVQIWNHLHSEIHVLLTESNQDLSVTERYKNIGKQATISSGSSAYLYANPAMIYFTVTLTSFNSSCKAVNSADWVKKLQKKKSDANFLDINLDFDGGKYFASLRLSRSDKGMLEAAVFTSYVLQNDSDISLLCCASDGKLLSRLEVDEYGSSLPPDVGTYLPPKTTKSWFVKSNRMKLTSLEEKGSAAVLDLDIISGFTEICLETHVGPDARYISKLGVSLRPWNKMSVPSQIVLMVPRYVISNETEQPIFVRQHYLEEDIDGIISVDGKHKVALKIKFGSSIRREVNLFDSLFRKHKHSAEDSLIYIQFCIGDIGWSWSGPICVSSLGRFFLKFKRQNISSQVTDPESKLTEFAVVHVLEEGSSLVLRFDRPPNFSPPYRIENLLPNASITYCQKDSADPETLGPKSSVGYVWDDLSLPHQLVVQITGINLSREINMDKVRAWKPIFKVRQQRGLALELPLDKKSRDQIKSKDESHGLETLKVGYEVYADGHTRVLRISEFPGRSKGDAVFQLSGKFQFRIFNLVIHLLENKRQEEQLDEPSVYSPVVVARLGNITLKSLFTDPNKYNQITVQSINVDEKWVGAPFAAMLRRNESDFTETNENILQIVIILLSTDSGVRKVKYASTVLQPLQLNLDEETLIKFVPFWRTSLSDPNVKSQQFYFEHFEIHPIKVVASFLPGSSDSSYSSAQETLRSFLHSIVKIPAVKSKNVELNGILLTHALVTVRDLFFKCAQHYSWYGMRAVYIAKGSPLLPPAFASIFDDSASSSLDIFFDPSSGVVNLPGITLGMFKFISKCIDKNGFSGTKRYFGDLGKTVKTAGSNVLFAAVTEISDCVLKGAEANGFNGMMNGFHQGILKLAMEPSVLGTAVMEGGPDRKIKLDRSPGVDELYIEGYLQAMLDTIYKQEYLRVRVLDYQVILKNLPPNTSLMNEIMDRVRSFLISKALLKGESSTTSHPLRHLRGESEWRIGPTILTLWEHLFVSFAIRLLRKQTLKFLSDLRGKRNSESDSVETIVPSPVSENKGIKLNIKWGVQKFVLSGIVAYLDGRLCRRIPNAVVRRIVSGFLLSLLDDNNDN